MLAPGYGRLNDAVREALELAARRDALLLDPVYTGKAMAGLIAHMRAWRIAPGSRVLFLHTGGLPAIFAYADRLGPWLSKVPWPPAGCPDDAGARVCSGAGSRMAREADGHRPVVRPMGRPASTSHAVTVPRPRVPGSMSARPTTDSRTKRSVMAS